MKRHENVSDIPLAGPETPTITRPHRSGALIAVGTVALMLLFALVALVFGNPDSLTLMARALRTL